MTKDQIKYLTTEIAAANLFLGFMLSENIDLRDESEVHGEMKAVLRAGDRAAHAIEDLTIRELLAAAAPADTNELANTALSALMTRRKLINQINARNARPAHH